MSHQICLPRLFQLVRAVLSCGENSCLQLTGSSHHTSRFILAAHHQNRYGQMRLTTEQNYSQSSGVSCLPHCIHTSCTESILSCLSSTSISHWFHSHQAKKFSPATMLILPTCKFPRIFRGVKQLSMSMGRREAGALRWAGQPPPRSSLHSLHNYLSSTYLCTRHCAT